MATKPHLYVDLEGFEEKLRSVIDSPQWKTLGDLFRRTPKILLLGNGGNLAVVSHGAVDICRLTNKDARVPDSPIVQSSLVNEAGWDEWMTKWLEFRFRDTDPKDYLVIGVSSTGFSENIMRALEAAVAWDAKVALITHARENPNFLNVCLNISHYHTGEVMTLALFYQLIEEYNERPCPSIP